MADGAFGPYAPGTPQFSKYEEYLNNRRGLMADQGNAPAAQQPASQGALQGPAGAPAGPAFGPTKEAAGEPSDFFGMWKMAPDEDKDAIVDSVMEPIEGAGMSVEGAAKMLFDKEPKLAAEVGAKFGIVPPADKAGMPGFKTQEAALADYEKSGRELAEQKAQMKKERRQAYGAFLFEMGLRTLASERGDAGGAIAEGALGTMQARRQRGIEESERAWQTSERTRTRKMDEAKEARAEAKNRREEAKEARAQEEFDIKKAAGTLGIQGEYNFERQWNFYDKYYKSKIPDDDERAQSFLDWYKNASRYTKADKNKEIQKWIDRINDGEASEPDGWYEMSASEQKKFIIEMFPELGGNTDDAGSDPLGLR